MHISLKIHIIIEKNAFCYKCSFWPKGHILLPTHVWPKMHILIKIHLFTKKCTFAVSQLQHFVENAHFNQKLTFLIHLHICSFPKKHFKWKCILASMHITIKNLHFADNALVVQKLILIQLQILTINLQSTFCHKRCFSQKTHILSRYANFGKITT